MRPLLIIALLAPFFSAAQINRSAREFASEKIGEYISGKLFKDMTYKPVSFGELKNNEESAHKEIIWSLEHRFVITDTLFEDGKRQPVIHSYKFVFYLDRRMNVQRAESYEVQ